jgi:Cu2+-exporting ATPase
VPALLPVAGALFLYTALPRFKGAWRVLANERRLGVDVLDSIVVLACLSTMQILLGAILSWCLSFGRYLVRRTEDSSKKMLLSAFGKQPRFAFFVEAAKRSRFRSTSSGRAISSWCAPVRWCRWTGSLPKGWR